LLLADRHDAGLVQIIPRFRSGKKRQSLPRIIENQVFEALVMHEKNFNDPENRNSFPDKHCGEYSQGGCAVRTFSMSDYIVNLDSRNALPAGLL
jgi:hypothetical protein